jgi:hypothetical protein
MKKAKYTGPKKSSKSLWLPKKSTGRTRTINPASGVEKLTKDHVALWEFNVICC